MYDHEYDEGPATHDFRKPWRTGDRLSNESSDRSGSSYGTGEEDLNNKPGAWVLFCERYAGYAFGVLLGLLFVGGLLGAAYVVMRVVFSLTHLT